MKLKQLINGGALAATVLTLGSAQAEPNPYEGIVFCKATILRANEDDPSSISVTLPFTTTGTNGQQYTHWNLGKVAAGGVADSWHSEKGPGKFVAHNDGYVGAYIYLTSSEIESPNYREYWMSSEKSGVYQDGMNAEVERNQFTEIFGEASQVWMRPTPFLSDWRSNVDGDNWYCLAFTRDMEAKNPTWHMLNHVYCNDGYVNSDYHYRWREGDEVRDHQMIDYIGEYMGYLPAGDYMPFDVKFWAPCDAGWMFDEKSNERIVNFTFRVEAASFPLWEHDRDVQ